MKTKYLLILLGIGITSFFAWEEDAVQQIEVAPSGGQVKFYNFAVGGPTINFYMDNIKMTVVGSTTGVEAVAGLGVNGVYPTQDSYLSTGKTGSVTFKATVPSNATANPGTVTASIPATLADGKYYSVFTSGIYDATSKTTSGFVLEDNFPAIDTGFAYIRFINTISNTPNGYDLKIVNTTTTEQINVASATAYKTAAPFVKVPNGVYNLTATSVNTPTNYTITRSSLSLSKGFIYTIATRGNPLVTGNTGLDMTRNR